eukprot:scaffold16089_cov31-Attheya_sp.AAC.1
MSEWSCEVSLSSWSAGPTTTAGSSTLDNQTIPEIGTVQEWISRSCHNGERKQSSTRHRFTNIGYPREILLSYILGGSSLTLVRLSFPSLIFRPANWGDVDVGDSEWGEFGEFNDHAIHDIEFSGNQCEEGRQPSPLN